MRVLLAGVLSICAVVAVAAHELAPERVEHVCARLGWERKTPSVAPPEVEAIAPVDPSDLDPVGPARLRPPRTEGRRHRR